MDDRVAAGASAPLAACSGAGAEFSTSDFTAPIAPSGLGEAIAAVSNGFGFAMTAFGAQVFTFRRSVKEVETTRMAAITERAAISTTPSYPRLRRGPSSATQSRS